MIETQPITLAQKELVESLRRRYGHTSSSHAFASLLVWQEDMKLSIHLEEDLFAVRCGLRGENAWFFPCGGSQAVKDFLQRTLEKEHARLCYLREEDAVFLERSFPGRFQIALRQGDCEYLYDRASQESLEGGKFLQMRKDVHRIERQHALKCVPITPENLETARAVCQAWNWVSASSEGLRDEWACMRLLDNWTGLGASGVLVYVDGEPCSVSAGYPLTEDVFDISVSKQTERLTGLPVYSRRALIQSLPPEVTLLNAEEDLDLEGLRYMKQRMHPVDMVELYEGRV